MEQGSSKRNLKDVVIPITMVFSMIGLAFNAGVQYARLSYVESTTHEMVVALQQITKDLNAVRQDVAVHVAHDRTS